MTLLLGYTPRPAGHLISPYGDLRTQLLIKSQVIALVVVAEKVLNLQEVKKGIREAGDSKEVKFPPDYYTNEDYWQEYDCPTCLLDFDVSPIPLPDTTVRCSGCGTGWKAGEHRPITYLKSTVDDCVVVDYPALVNIKEKL
jgi:hypothetical protein